MKFIKPAPPTPPPVAKPEVYIEPKGLPQPAPVRAGISMVALERLCTAPSHDPMKSIF
jgi:hypothetical protein